MTEQQKTFTTSDGTELFYRYRPAKDGSTDKAIVLFHRGHEHSGRLMYLADELGLDDFAFFAWDARGHGNSPGARGDSPGIATSVADIQDFMHHCKAALLFALFGENSCTIHQRRDALLFAPMQIFMRQICRV